MKRSSNIGRLSSLLLLQIILFMIVYLAFIALGAGLICLLGYSLMYLWELVKMGAASALFVFAPLYIFVGSFLFVVALYLIKPIFALFRKQPDKGVKLSREDSPRLYDLIMETAKEVGVSAPKNIYVTQEVNAAVRIPTGIGSLLFPVYRDMVVGLALFKSTNVAEVKSIIAHEFGHFAQGRVRFKSLINAAEFMMQDLAYRRDNLDDMLVRWCLHENWKGYCGRLIRLVVNGVRSVNQFLFRSFHRNILKLSRHLEYDADEVACRIAGSDTFISGLCKVRLLDYSFASYANMVSMIHNNRDMGICNFWDYYDLMSPCFEISKIRTSSFDRLESTPDPEPVKSRVFIGEVLDTHPSLENRIEHARSLAIVKETPESKIPAWDLIESKLSDQVSKVAVRTIVGREFRSVCTPQQFAEYAYNVIRYSIFPGDCDGFFKRVLILDGHPDNSGYPFTDANRAIIVEFNQAQDDQKTLNAIKKNPGDLKHIFYNGTCYSVDNLPIAEHNQYVEQLRARVAVIDANIRAYALSVAKNPDDVQAAYQMLEYAQPVLETISENFDPVRDEIVKDLRNRNISGDTDFQNTCKWFQSYEDALKTLFQNLKYFELNPYMEKYFDRLTIEAYIKKTRSFISSINFDDINIMFSMTDRIRMIHMDMCHFVQKLIADTIMDIPHNDSINTMLWKYGKAAREKDNGRPIYLIQHMSSQDSEDGHEHIVIFTEYGTRNFVIPTDEQIDKIAFDEMFRQRMWQVRRHLAPGKFLSFDMVCTVPLEEYSDGSLEAKNPDDKELVDREYLLFLDHFEDLYHCIKWDKVEENADAFDRGSMSRLALHYVEQNRYDEAFNWSALYTKENLPHAAVALALYISNYAPEHDHKSASDILKIDVALSGCMEALYHLALCYLNGDGVEKNEKRAAALMKRSAMQGYYPALYRWGLFNLYGIGVDPNKDEGVSTLYDVANFGHNSIDAVNALWKYFKKIGDREEYIRIVEIGADNNIDECLAELDNIPELKERYR